MNSASVEQFKIELDKVIDTLIWIFFFFFFFFFFLGVSSDGLASLWGTSLIVTHCNSPTLARGLGWSFVPYPLFCRLGLVPRSVAQLCALQPLVPSFRVYLSEAVGFGGFLGSLLCAPLAVGLPPGSPNRLCPLSADCLLGLEPSPAGVASASAGRFSWHPGAVGALAVPSLRLRVSESSSLSAWSFPFRGL